VEEGLLDVLEKEGIGCIVFSPLAQGLLTDRYLQGIPADSRAARSIFLRPENITAEVMAKVTKLNEIARARGQKLSQMAISWVLRRREVTSALIGASKVSQIEDAVAALQAPPLSAEELKKIEEIL
jgi:L-glyceraldehyde 3-phosphate reductase